MKFARVKGSPWKARAVFMILEPKMSRKTMPVMPAVSNREAFRVSQDRERLRRPQAVRAMTPTAAPSVGVKIPPYMPPREMVKIEAAGMSFLRAYSLRASGAFLSTPPPEPGYRMLTHQTVAEKRRRATIAGSREPMNISRILCSARKA